MSPHSECLSEVSKRRLKLVGVSSSRMHYSLTDLPLKIKKKSISLLMLDLSSDSYLQSSSP